MSPDAPAAEPRALRGSARDFAWLYSPPPLRGALAALLDIEREIGAALRPGLDHTVAHVRLAWWREECERCAGGRPAHPATRALAAVVDRPDPGGLVDIATWDLAAATFGTRAELAGYCDRWAAAVTETAARSAAPAEAADRDVRARFGRALGGALKEIELLTALAVDARAGRLRLPLDELSQAGIEPVSLASAPWPSALRRLIDARHRAARTALAASVDALPPDDQPALRGLLVWAALAHRASRRAERVLPLPGSRHADGRVSDRAERIADAWLAWRAARRAERGRFRLERETIQT